MSSTFLVIYRYTPLKGGEQMLELYKNIKRLRKEKKMSQEKLAELTGYTDRSSIAKIEKGEVNISQSKIMLFAEALGVSAGALMGNDGVVEHDGETEDFISGFQSLSPSHQKAILEYIDFLSVQEHHDDAQK